MDLKSVRRAASTRKTKTPPKAKRTPRTKRRAPLVEIVVPRIARVEKERAPKGAKLHGPKRKVEQEPIDQGEAQLLVVQHHLAAPQRAPAIAPQRPTAPQGGKFGHRASGASAHQAHGYRAALREAKVVPVVAKERDIEPPRGFKVDRLRQPKAIAPALQRPRSESTGCCRGYS